MKFKTEIKPSLLKLLTFFEFLFLLLGVSLPLATIDEFWIFSSEFSVLSIAYTLIGAREYVLSVIIITFGLIFPILKIMQRSFDLGLFQIVPLHKFALVDIFLLSFLVFGGKLSYFFDVNLQLGFYLMVAAVIISYLQVIIAHNTCKNKL